MKHLKYLKYLMRHKAFVLYAGLLIGAPLYRLIIHDWSKFLPSEFFAYLEMFYGKNKNVKAKLDFLKAWLLHQHRNKHHWQYWVLREDDGGTVCLQMPDRYVLEMVADWAGAGRGITGKWDFLYWYQDHKANIRLDPRTRELAEHYILVLNHKLTEIQKLYNE